MKVKISSALKYLSTLMNMTKMTKINCSRWPILVTAESDWLIKLRRKAVGLIKEFVHVSTLHKLHVHVSQKVNQDLDIVSYLVLILVLHEREDHINTDLISWP